VSISAGTRSAVWRSFPTAERQNCGRLLVAAVRERFPLPLLTALLSALPADGVPILEALLAMRGQQSPPPGAEEVALQLDLAGYEREARQALRHAICRPLMQDQVLHVHLLAPALQARLEEAGDTRDVGALFDAVARAAEDDTRVIPPLRATNQRACARAPARAHAPRLPWRGGPDVREPAPRHEH
jgi:hypothetical protein